MNKKTSPCLFGKALVRARKQRGISQYRLARLMERSVQQISKLERGEREPLFSTILRLERALGIEHGELVREAAEEMAAEDAHSAVVSM